MRRVNPNLRPRNMLRLRPIPTLEGHRREMEKTRNHRMVREDPTLNVSAAPILQQLRGTPYKVTNCGTFAGGFTRFTMKQSGMNLQLLPPFLTPILHQGKLMKITIEITHDATGSATSVHNQIRDSGKQFTGKAKRITERGTLSSPIDHCLENRGLTNKRSGSKNPAGLKDSRRPFNIERLRREVSQQTNTGPRTSIRPTAWAGAGAPKTWRSNRPWLSPKPLRADFTPFIPS